MQSLSLDQQNRQMAVLSSELRQMERNKQELASDIDRLNTSKKAAFAEATNSTKDLQRRSDQLTIKIEKLREEAEFIQQQYDDTVRLNREYPLQAKREADQILSDAKQTADNMERTALAVKDEAERLLYEAKGKEDEIAVAQGQLNTDRAKLEEDTKTYLQLVKEWRENGEIRQQLKEQHNNEIVELEKKIEALMETKSILTRDNNSLQNRMQIDQQDINRRVADVRIRETAQENLKRMLDKQKHDQEQENILIKDRQGQLDRAIVEWQQKGVILNG
jgi:hypothetical protein